MSTSTVSVRAATAEPSKALRYWAVGLTVCAVVAMLYMMSGLRPEGWLLDVSEASSALVAPIALVVNVVSVVRHHRAALDIASLSVSALVIGVYVVDSIVYMMTPLG